MVDYFRRLALRSLQPQVVVQPRLAGRFEPLQPGDPFGASKLEMDEGASLDELAEDRPRMPSDRVSPAPVRPMEAPWASSRSAQFGEQAGSSLRSAQQSPLPPAPDRMRVSDGEAGVPALVPAPRSELPPVQSVQTRDGERDRSASQPDPRPPAHTQPVGQQPDPPQPVVIQPILPQPAAPLGPPRLELRPVLAPPADRPGPAPNKPAPPPAQPAPVVNISIGRIEVRASQASKPATAARKSRAAPLVMNLEEYLKKRNGGGG